MAYPPRQADRGFLREKFKVKTTPLLKDLYQHITPRYATDWKVIGTQLGLSIGELKAIEAGWPANVKWCCNQMLQKWLEMDTTASWGKLFTVIESPAVLASHSSPDKELAHHGSRPSMSKLKKHVIPSVATKWRHLGSELLDSKYKIELDKIEENYGNKEKKCRKMFSKWLNTDELASWEKLIEAVRIVQLNNVASDIEQLLLKGVITNTRSSFTYSNQPTRVGTQLTEYEVFVQYYNKLKETLKYYSHQLYTGGSHRRIITCFMEFKISKLPPLSLYPPSLCSTYESPSDIEVLLAEVAIRLHSGNTHLFYEMLKVMRTIIRDAKVRKLAAEVKAKINSYVPYMLHGSQLRELDTFMQYYWKLAPQMRFIDADMLCFSYFDADIITDNDMRFIRHYKRTPRVCKQEIILIRMTDHLLSGNINLFYEMLEILQICGNPIIDHLVREIHVSLGYKFSTVAQDTIYPREYEVFMQFHDLLTKTLWGYADELCKGFHKDLVITSFEEKEIMNSPRSHRIDMLLSTLAVKLHRGNTTLFSKVLKRIGLYKKDADIQKMALKMQAKFQALNKSNEKQPVVQETQTVAQETQAIVKETQSATKQKTQQSDLEYKLFMQYHSKLSDVLSLVDLTSHFVAANIITSSDGQAVINTMIIESQTAAALRKLLNKISLALLCSHDDSKLFHKMLRIMQVHGDDTAQCLAAEMLKAVEKTRSGVPVTYEFLDEEEIPLISSATFDHHGGELIIEEHDVTITVPELAISEGEKVQVRAVASLTGPYQLPDGYDLVSVFVWIEADYRFRKLVKITIPHFASIENLDQRFGVVVLTANEKDLVLNKNGDSLLQLHESVYDYQYEVNDDYCDYYTDHFCSKCLARRRSFIFRLFNRLTLSPREEISTSRTRITVFFCVPDDYATANELLIELCICYSLKHCLQTVHKSYKQRRMLSTKSSNVPWTVAIDNQKCQNFCISCGDCPGWKIKPIGLEKINVSDLDFYTYGSPEDLRAEEELYMYPPRFKISVNRLSHGKKLELDTEFKIVLENDGVLATDEVRKFPLIITKSATEVPLDQRFTTDVDCTLTSTTVATTSTTTTATTATTTMATTTGPSSTSNVSIASSYQSTTVSDDSSSTAMTVATASGSPSATDITAITKLDQMTLADLPVSHTTAGNTFVRQNVIVQGDIYNIYQSNQPHLGVEQSGGSFNSLECFASDITGRVDMTMILPYLISYGLLTPEQQDYLTHSGYTSSDKKQKLCNILLRLNENDVKKFLLCLSETSDYDPHKQLLEKIRSKMKEAADDDDDDDDDDDAPV